MDNPTPFSSQPNSPEELQALKQEQFELLSAYLDGEVTATERYQVEAWLTSDAEFQQLHQRLLKLQQGFHQAPYPLSVAPEVLVNQVLTKASKGPRTLLAWTGVGAIAAATVVGVISSTFPGLLSPIPLTETAAADLEPIAVRKSPAATPLFSPEANLMLTLDRPPIAIPVAQPVVNSTQELGEQMPPAGY